MTIAPRMTGAVAAAATLALLVTVNFVGVGTGEDGGLGPFLVTAAVALGAWLLAFGWYPQRASQPARGGLAASVFGLATVILFWTGLPIVLGAAGVALGSRGHRTSPREGAAAIALGLLAIAGSIAFTIYDQLN